ncbi:DUF6261 family protein [Capnocytophaga stomatis]|uniref:DUF6261 family protein n=1 Tax=Capnocytophaga stomatis TaxID=1848904 RepID=A0A250FUD6_9FLAO|nr:DUF6261 family protein [Capnocytophaga stomatis]ATA88779.1 hypothetical protein CGC58_02980 [Capnocytophaga stomatis]GIJ97032.1 hypothetical protein CAPN001_16010 [Capnocytophaga stomatis]
MNNKVKGLKIQALQNHEHFGFVSELKLVLEQANIDELAKLLEQFSLLVEEENRAFERTAKSSHTKTLSMLDKESGNYYRGLLACVNSAKYSPVKEEKEAADLLLILIKSYGYFISESYESQHSKTVNFIQDMRSEKYKKASELVGTVRWVDWFEKANQNFMEVYRTRRDEKASSKAGTRPLKSVRKEIDEVYRNIVNHLNALNVLKPSNEIIQLTSRINVLIDRLSATMASRSTRAKKKDDDSKKQVS